jgi:hypothetical protein
VIVVHGLMRLATQTVTPAEYAAAQHSYRQYRSRWYTITVLSLLNVRRRGCASVPRSVRSHAHGHSRQACNAMCWVTYAPIATVAAVSE